MLGIRVSCRAEKNLWPRYKSNKIRQVIIAGDPSLDKKWRLDGNILYLRCRDNWEHLPEKMIAAYSAIVQINEFKKYNHFLKLDRDSIITNSFNAHRSSVVRGRDYIAQYLHTPHRTRAGVYHLGRISKDSPWYNKRYREFRGIKSFNCTFGLGGHSYILSRNAISKIRKFYTIDNLHTVEKDHIYEDLMVGYLMMLSGTKPYKLRYGIHAGGKPYKGCHQVLRNNPEIWRT